MSTMYLYGPYLYIAGEITTTKIYKKEEIKKVVIDVIAKTFDIDQKDISTKELWGWIYVFWLDLDQHLKYKICRFEWSLQGDSPQEISIFFNKNEVEDAGLGEITKESAEVMAKEIIKEIPNIEIHIYSESDLEGTIKLLYPPDKNILEKLFRY